MTRRELAELCLAFPDSYEDAPFHDPNWTVIRHRSNRKCFAMIYERGGNLCINLKCDPMRADFLCKVYEGIDPGYHMNKQHSAILRRPTTLSPTCTATSLRATGTPNGSTTSCGRATSGRAPIRAAPRKRREKQHDRIGDHAARQTVYT